MAELTFLLGLISTGFITYLFIKWIIRNKGKQYANGQFGFPIAGHLPLFGKHPPTTFMKWWKLYGDVFYIRTGSWDTVVVNGYSAVKAAAEQENDAFSGRPQFITMQLMKECMNEGVCCFGNLSSEYSKQRKLTSATLRLFTFKRPEVINELVSNEAITCADTLIRKHGKTPGYIDFDVQTLVVRIMYQFLYGRGKNVDIEKHVEVIMKSVDEFIEFSRSGSVIDVLPWLRYIMPWRIDKFKRLLTQADSVTLEQVREHHVSFSKDYIRDVADSVLASNMHDQESQDKYVLTRSKLNVILFELQQAGTETTRNTLAWLFLYMAAYPRVQQQVYAERNKVVGKGRKVELSDKPNLVYTNAVIYEVMRIVSQLPFSSPHYAVEDGEIEGVHVDKGTVVIFHLYSVHHEKEFWGYPECFRPERLILDNNSLDKEKCNHILPFGLGRRRCIGKSLAKMNVFLSFATVIQKCKFVLPVGERPDLSPIPRLVYAPKNFKVQVLARN